MRHGSVLDGWVGGHRGSASCSIGRRRRCGRGSTAAVAGSAAAVATHGHSRYSQGCKAASDDDGGLASGAARSRCSELGAADLGLGVDARGSSLHSRHFLKCSPLDSTVVQHGSLRQGHLLLSLLCGHSCTAGNQTGVGESTVGVGTRVVIMPSRGNLEDSGVAGLQCAQLTLVDQLTLQLGLNGLLVGDLLQLRVELAACMCVCSSTPPCSPQLALIEKRIGTVMPCHAGLPSLSAHSFPLETCLCASGSAPAAPARRSALAPRELPIRAQSSGAQRKHSTRVRGVMTWSLNPNTRTHASSLHTALTNAHSTAYSVCDSCSSAAASQAAQICRLRIRPCARSCLVLAHHQQRRSGESSRQVGAEHGPLLRGSAANKGAPGAWAGGHAQHHV